MLILIIVVVVLALLPALSQRPSLACRRPSVKKATAAATSATDAAGRLAPNGSFQNGPSSRRPRSDVEVRLGMAGVAG